MFGNISRVDLDAKGNIYVLDYKFRKIVVFDREGKLLRTIAVPAGQGPREATNLGGIAVTPGGTLFVNDMQKVIVYGPDGQYVRTFLVDFMISSIGCPGTEDLVAIGPNGGKILHVLGFAVVEGYGLTETSPVVCCGSVGEHRLGTVGKPLDGVEVRIAGDGEILVRGPNVMKGYLNKPEETAQVLDADGWLHTGDLGEFDGDGNLSVTGRSKEIIVTSYGKNVAPAPVEGRIARSPYVSQVVVFGDNRKSIVALIVPNRAALERFARERNIATGGTYSALLAQDAVRELMGDEVKKANAEAASYERVVAFELLAEPFSEESGTLTPTLKVRRKKVAQTCTDLIEALYDRLEGKRAH